MYHIAGTAAGNRAAISVPYHWNGCREQGSHQCTIQLKRLQGTVSSDSPISFSTTAPSRLSLGPICYGLSLRLRLKVCHSCCSTGRRQGSAISVCHGVTCVSLREQFFAGLPLPRIVGFPVLRCPRGIHLQMDVVWLCLFF